MELKEYKSNYFGTGKNGLATITYIEGLTDKRFSYTNRKLDEKESKKDFELEYVSLAELIEKLKQNRTISQIQNKELITTEMIYVITEYQKHLRERLKETTCIVNGEMEGER